MAFCRNCGAPVDENAKFCAKCGAGQIIQASSAACTPARLSADHRACHFFRALEEHFFW